MFGVGSDISETFTRMSNTHQDLKWLAANSNQDDYPSYKNNVDKGSITSAPAVGISNRYGKTCTFSEPNHYHQSSSTSTQRNVCSTPPWTIDPLSQLYHWAIASFLSFSFKIETSIWNPLDCRFGLILIKCLGVTLVDVLKRNHLGSNGWVFRHRMRLLELHSPYCSTVGNLSHTSGHGLNIEGSLFALSRVLLLLFVVAVDCDWADGRTK